MKNTIALLLLLASFSGTAFTLTAQQKKVETIQFEVGGVCEMCKERIESALDVKGVKFAEYDLDEHLLTVTFKTKQITEEQIHQRIADVGHDTNKVKVKDDVYDSIHHCCEYREHEDHHGEEHK